MDDLIHQQIQLKSMFNIVVVVNVTDKAVTRRRVREERMEWRKLNYLYKKERPGPNEKAKKISMFDKDIRRYNI